MPNSSSQSVIAVIQYAGEFDSGKLYRLLDKHADIDLYYSGLIAGQIGTGKVSDDCNKVPCIINGIHVLKSESASVFETLIGGSDFQSLAETPQHLYVGLYNRIL